MYFYNSNFTLDVMKNTTSASILPAYVINGKYSSTNETNVKMRINRKNLG